MGHLRRHPPRPAIRRGGGEDPVAERGSPGIRESRPRPAATGGAAGSGGRETLGLLSTWGGVHALRLATQSLLAWSLLPAGRGEYAVAVLFATLAGVVLTLSVDRGAQYFSMAGRIGLSRCLGAGFTVCLVGSAAAAGGALLLMGSGFSLFDRAEPAAFRVALLLAALVPLAAVTERQLAGMREFRAVSFLLLARPAAALAAMLVLVRGLGLGVPGAVLALAAGHSVFLFAGVRELRRRAGARLELPSSSELSRILAYGFRSHAARIGEALTPRLGVLALAALAGGAEEIGWFAAASAVMMPLSLLGTTAATALIPRVAGREVKRAETVGVLVRIVCFVTAGATAVFFAVAEPVVAVLFSEAFLPAVPLMWLMAPGIVAYAGVEVFGAWFSGVERPEAVSWATGVGLAVHVAAVVVLAPRFGAAGVAAAMSLDFLARLAFLGLRFRRTANLPLRAVWTPRRGDAAYLRSVLERALARRGGGRSVTGPDGRRPDR